jgi:hypothetical protein
MRGTILLTGLLLAACGGAPSATVTTADGTTVTASGNGSVSVKAGNGTADAGTMACTSKPDFVPLYADAKLVTCASGATGAKGRGSGTAIYTTAATPAQILAWSKEQAEKAGLAQKLLTDMTYTAAEGDKRTLSVMAMAQGGGTQVTVNWGVGS